MNEKEQLNKLEALKKAYKAYNSKAVAEAQAISTKNTAGVIPHINGDFDIPASRWVGENIIRFVPPRADDDSKNLTGFFLKTSVYWIQGRTRLASDCFGGNQCPLIKAFFDAHNNKDAEKKRYFNPGTKYFAFIENYTGIKDGEKPVLELAAIPKLLWAEIVGRAKNRKTNEALDICHPISGRQVGFSKVGDGVGTKYTNAEIYADESPVRELYDLPRFDQILKPISREEANEIVAGYQPAAKDDDTGLTI